MLGRREHTIGTTDGNLEGFTVGIDRTDVLTEVGAGRLCNGLRVESAVGSEDGGGIRAVGAWNYSRIALDVDVD